LPNPLDISRYKFRQRRQVGSTLVWLRAFHTIYNPSLAANVVARLTESGDDTRLIMIGPDKKDGSRERFDALAVKLGVTGSVSVVGSVSKSAVPDWLQRGDVFVNTARVDNTPVSVMEAMATGLCIVSTDVGGIPYLLQHEQDALLVPSDDPAAMAAAVRRLQAEPGLAARLSANARAKAETFDWSQVLPQWERILSQSARWRPHDHHSDDHEQLPQVTHETSCA
jgi:glycosyltransferase involved in cell wall biosynthesis